jgi:CBS domain-containing protein
MDVERILDTKGRKVVTTRPDTSVAEAVSRLRAEGIGAMVVLAGSGRLDGIISERDIVRGLARHGRTVLDLKVADLMTRAVTTCSPKDTVKAVMAVMTERRVRHLPVVEAGRLLGIVSIGDVVKNRLDEMELEVNVLRDAYLTRR